MLKFIQVLVVLSLVNISIAVTASAETVCSSGADYTNGAAALRALEPGGELLFCRGETFPMGGTYQLGDMQGAYVGAYGSGEIPTLTGQLFFERSPTSNLTFDGLRLRGSGSGHGMRLDSGTNNITVTNSVIENYNVAIFLKKPSGTDPVINFTLSHSVIQNNHSQGFLGGGPGTYVGHNTFLNNGQRGMFDHNIYFSCGDFGDSSPPCPMMIEYNNLQGSSQDSAGRCAGAPIVGHGYVNGTTIRNNIIQEPDGAVGTCYGIMVNPSYSRVELLSNVTITGNQIYDVGRVGIYVEATDGIRISDNVIYITDSSRDMSHVGIQVGNGSEPARGGNYVADAIIENNDIKLWRGTGIHISSDVPASQFTTSNNSVEVRTNISQGLVYPPPPAPLVLPEISEIVAHMNRTSANLGGNFALDFNGDGTVGADDLAALMMEQQKRR